MARRERIMPAVLTFFAVGIPTAGVVVIAAWLGAAAVGALVSLLVVVAGVLLAGSPVPLEVERTMILESLDRGEPLSRAQVRKRLRWNGIQIGCAVALAGGIGLAVALAAL
jgi:hypothetical protein